MRVEFLLVSGEEGLAEPAALTTADIKVLTSRQSSSEHYTLHPRH